MLYQELIVHSIFKVFNSEYASFYNYNIIQIFKSFSKSTLQYTIFHLPLEAHIYCVIVIVSFEFRWALSRLFLGEGAHRKKWTFTWGLKQREGLNRGLTVKILLFFDQDTPMDWSLIRLVFKYRHLFHLTCLYNFWTLNHTSWMSARNGHIQISIKLVSFLFDCWHPLLWTLLVPLFEQGHVWARARFPYSGVGLVLNLQS